MDELIASIWKKVDNNGTKYTKVSALIKMLGVSKRSEKIVEQINNAFSENGLFIQPELEMITPWNQQLRIQDYDDKPLGDLFKDEWDLETYIDQNELYKKLGIESVDRQHSPKRTRDRLDFLGFTEEELVILELKNWGGGNSAVEQVLRYVGHKKNEFKGKPEPKIRKILVTGIANRDTVTAINGMRPEERENFEWYLYNYCAKTGELDFVRVTDQEIEKRLST